MSKTIVDRYDKKLMILKYLHHLVQTLKKNDNNTDGGTFGVYSYFFRKLMHYLFGIIEKRLVSKHNPEKSTVI